MPEFIMMDKEKFDHIISMVSETNRLIHGLTIKQNDDFISNEDLALKLKIHKQTLGTWRKGGLKFHARGRNIFYKMSEVEDFLTLKKSK